MNARYRRRRRRAARPVRLGELVDQRARKWRFKHLARLETIRSHWAAAAGDFVAGHVQPARLVRRQLRLAVDDAAWGNELTYLAPAILERLRELLPGNWIDELKVVPGEPMPEPEPAPEPAPPLPPPDPAMQAAADEAAAGLADPELAAAVRRASLARLRRLDAARRAGHHEPPDDSHPREDGEEP